MENEMIERLARVMCEAWRKHEEALMPPLGPGQVVHRLMEWDRASEIWKFLARTTVAAMREPTETMIAAGSCGGDWPHAKETWRKMIDAALP